MARVKRHDEKNVAKFSRGKRGIEFQKMRHAKTIADRGKVGKEYIKFKNGRAIVLDSALNEVGSKEFTPDPLRLFEKELKVRLEERVSNMISVDNNTSRLANLEVCEEISNDENVPVEVRGVAKSIRENFDK